MDEIAAAGISAVLESEMTWAMHARCFLVNNTVSECSTRLIRWLAVRGTPKDEICSIGQMDR
jgi:hypothetical protein